MTPALLSACAVTLVLYLGTYMRIPLVPLYARELGASTVEVGAINAVFMLAAALLSLPLGLASDRIGRRRLVLSGIAVASLASLLLPAARTPLHVGLIYLFGGAGLACFSPAMMFHVGDIAPSRHLGKAYGWYTSALYTGMALGPGVGGIVAGWGFGPAFAVSALIIAAGFLAGVFRMVPDPPGPGAARRGGTFRADFREVVRNRAVLDCWAATFFSTYAWGSMFAFFPLYAREAGISVLHTGFLFTTQAASNALFRVPAGHLQDGAGDRRPFIRWGSAVFGVLISMTGAFGSETPLYLLFVGAGASMGVTFTAIGALLSESVDLRVRGLAMGGYNTFIYGGFMVSAATIGFVIRQLGFGAGFAFAGAMCALAGLFVGRGGGRGRVSRGTA